MDSTLALQVFFTACESIRSNLVHFVFFDLFAHLGMERIADGD
jgi:hypothetical protein